MMLQTKIFDWVRDHRVHHKFSETNADPHNAKRGLFFSHCGWIMQAKHPLVIQQGKKLDVSDVQNDKVAQFFDEYVSIIVIIVMPCSNWIYFLGTSLFSRDFFAL